MVHESRAALRQGYVLMRNNVRTFAIWLGPALLVMGMLALMWRDFRRSASDQLRASQAIESGVRDLNRFWENLVQEQRAANARRDSVRRDSAR